MKRRRTTNPYDHPLYYDILHSPGTPAEVSEMKAAARRFLRVRGKVWTARDAIWVEPGCGTGRFLRVLAEQGCACVGLDINQGMVDFAAAELAARGFAEHARVVLGEMRFMDSPGMEAAIRNAAGATGGRRSRPIIAFCLHNSIRHLTSERAALSHLVTTRRLIGSAGLYVVGIGLIGEDGEAPSETVGFAKRAGITVREVMNFEPPHAGHNHGAQHDRFEKAYRYCAVSTPTDEHEFISRYKLRTYTLEQWHALVREAGLEETAVIGARGDLLPSAWLTYSLRVLRTPRR